MRLPSHHNRHPLAAPRFGEAHPDFHLEGAREFFQAGTHRGNIQLMAFPGGLDRHAELAAGDLLFESFDIGLLLEQETGDASDHAGFVPSDDGEGGEMSHDKTVSPSAGNIVLPQGAELVAAQGLFGGFIVFHSRPEHGRQ